MKNMRRGHLKISLLLYMFKSFHIDCLSLIVMNISGIWSECGGLAIT